MGTRTESEVTSRARDVLTSIVKTYIDTGEPVASRTISKLRQDNLSAATIRNVMADLAEQGYLSQPHTSAGRVPTAKAFRQYARALSAGRIAFVDAERMRDLLSKAETVEDKVEQSSRILTEITKNVGIAAATPASAQLLDQIELLALADGRVLMILVTRDRTVRHRMIALDETVTQDELNSLRNYVNRNFSGWRLWEARRELLRRIEQERAAYDEVLRRLSILYGKGLLEADASPEVHLEGASNLVGLDLHLTREKMRDLMRALEEKQLLVELLDRFLEQSPGEVQVRVGLEEVHPAMKELALIGLCFNMPTGFSARIAVLGPMRMHYERAISAVLFLGRALQSSQSS